MGIFDFALIKDEEKEKKLTPGWAQRMRGIGEKVEEETGTGTVEAEVDTGAKVEGKFDFALNPILLTTIEQEEKELKDFETTYEALNISIGADYNQYVELQKQLEEIGLDLETTPEELTWFLQKKFEEVKTVHNSLVDKLLTDTAEQKTIYESYTVIRDKYEKDVDTYNRFVNATKKETEPFIPPDYSPEKIAEQLKEGTYVKGERPDTLRNVLGAYATFGKGLSMLPKALKVTFLQAMGGKDAAGINDTEEIDDLLKATEDLDEFVKEAYMRYGSAGIFGIKITDLAELPQNLSYSIISSGAGAAVGIPVALIPWPGMRAAAWASGTAVSGLVAYRATEFQIMQSYLEFKNEESIRKTGKGINVEEEKLLKEMFAADAKKYALWEAVPEAIANLNFWGTLAKPLTKTVGKSAAGAIINKLTRMYLGEMSTEMITQMGQSGIEVKAGMREERPTDWTNPQDYYKALKEIAPMTFLLTTVMGGAGATVIQTGKAFKKISKSLREELGENNPLRALIEAKLIGMLVEQRGSFSWKDSIKKSEGKKPKNIEEAKEELIKKGVKEEFLTPEFMKKYMEHPGIQDLGKADATKEPIDEEELSKQLKNLEEIEASAEELIAAAKDVEPTSGELEKIEKVNAAKRRFEEAFKVAKEERTEEVELGEKEEVIEPKVIDIATAFALKKREEVEAFIEKEWGEKIPANEIVTLGAADEWIIDKRLRVILKDVLDTQITVVEKFERPTIHGEVGKLPNGEFQIQLKRDLTDNEFARTLTEELLHVLKDKEGKTDYEAEQLLNYLERPTEKVVKEEVTSLLGEELFGIPIKKISKAKPAEKVTKPVSLKTQIKTDKRKLERLREAVQRAKDVKEDIKKLKQILHNYAKEMPLAIRGKMLTAIKTVTSTKKLNEAMTKIDKYVEDHYRRQYVKAIEKELTAKKIAPKKDKSGILRGKFTAEIQRALNIIKANIHSSRVKALEQIEQNIIAFEGGKVENVAGVNELLNMQGIKEMTLKDLESTLENIKTLKSTGRTIKAEKEVKRKEVLQGKVNKVLETITGKKLEVDEETGKVKIDTAYKTLLKSKWAEKGLLNRVKKGIDKLMNWQFGWDNLLDKLSVLDKTSKPYESALSKIGFAVQYARINQIKGVEEIITKLQESFRKSYGVEGRRAILNKVAENKVDVDLGTFKNAEGHEIQLVLNKEQIIKKYMQLEDPTLEKTFTKGMLYTEEIEGAIRGAITKEDLAYMDGLREIYDTIYDKVNPIYKDLYGVDLPRNPHYSGRILREGKEDIDITENLLQVENAIHYASVLNPSLKERSRTLSPLKYNEATPDILRYVLQMEHFVAFARPLQELRGIFNNSAVKAVIKQGYGSDIYRKITGFLEDITRDAIDKANVITFIDKIRGSFTRSILAKPIIGIKQVPSILAYMTEMPTADFFAGIANFWKNPIKNYRTLMELSPYAKERFGKGFERDIHSAMREGYGNTLASTHKFSDVFFTLIRMGDKLAVVQGMWAKMYSETGSKCLLAGNEKVAEGFRSAERSTERTQPTYTIESLATGQRGGSFLKLFTMFQNQINKYYRIIADNARNLRYGRGSRLKAASNITLAWVVLPLLFQLIGSAGRIKDKDLYRILLLGPLNNILVFGQMAKSIYGWLAGDTYDYQASPVTSTMRELGRALEKVAKWKDPTREMTTEDFVKMTEFMAKAVGQVVGAPTPYGVQVEKAVRSGDWRQFIYTPYSLAEEEGKKAGPVNMKKIYEQMGIKGLKDLGKKVPKAKIDMNKIYQEMGIKK